MFDFLKKKVLVSKDAKIFMGSMEVQREAKEQRRSPFNGKVVSTAPICSIDDVAQAYEIALMASKVSASSLFINESHGLKMLRQNFKRQEKIWRKQLLMRLLNHFNLLESK